MQLGMPSLIENMSLKKDAALCSSLGLDFLELNMNLPIFQSKELSDFSRLRSIADKYHIYYTVHLDENLDITNFNPAVAKAYTNTVLNVIQTAKKINIPLLNMHMNNGVYFTLPTEKIYLFGQYKDWYLLKIQEFRDLCENAIGDSEILISIENTNGFTDFQKEAVEQLLKSRVFSLTWDIGHSHAASDVDEFFIVKHKNRLTHFHIHDAVGRKNHLTLGTGEIDLIKRIEFAEKCKCRCVLEIKTIEALKESVIWGKAHGLL